MAAKITPFKFDSETLDIIDRLKTHLQPLSIGRPLTRADVVRHALRTLAAQTLPDAEPPKKSRKKSAE